MEHTAEDVQPHETEKERGIRSPLVECLCFPVNALCFPLTKILSHEFWHKKNWQSIQVSLVKTGLAVIQTIIAATWSTTVGALTETINNEKSAHDKDIQSVRVVLGVAALHAFIGYVSGCIPSNFCFLSFLVCPKYHFFVLFIAILRNYDNKRTQKKAKKKLQQ